MAVKFKVGDEVIVVSTEDNSQLQFLNKIFKISKFYEYGDNITAVEGITDIGPVTLFTYKLELLSVYESPLWKELE